MGCRLLRLGIALLLDEREVVQLFRTLFLLAVIVRILGMSSYLRERRREFETVTALVLVDFLIVFIGFFLRSNDLVEVDWLVGFSFLLLGQKVQVIHVALDLELVVLHPEVGRDVDFDPEGVVGSDLEREIVVESILLRHLL